MSTTTKLKDNTALTLFSPRVAKFSATLSLTAAAVFFNACSKEPEAVELAEAQLAEKAPTVVVDAYPAGEEPGLDAMGVGESKGSRLDQILAAQSQETQARYPYRNPKETIAFLGLKPGMTVVEVLPGGGWYSGILASYLGSSGRLVGLDYPSTIWTAMGRDQAYIDKRMARNQEWITKHKGMTDAAAVEFYAFDKAPKELNGQVDSVVFIRALHNMARLEEKGGFLSDSLAAVSAMLKPGGTVGIVQHAVAENAPDSLADGSKGYLKASAIKRAMSEAGFQFVAESDVNLNPSDQPAEGDSVWRLLPSLAIDKDDPEKQKAYRAIGESNRVTLLFRKPMS